MGDENLGLVVSEPTETRSTSQTIQPIQPILAGLVQAQTGLTDAVNFLAHMQAAHMRSSFEAMPLEQRDTYCQQMKNAGFGDSLEQITGRSYSTINRHLNGKNS